MALQVTIREGGTPRTVENERQLDEVLHIAADEARRLNFLGAVLIKADNGNYITMVVGGQETVLGFDSGELNSCYASKGASDEIEPLMTGYFMMWHHTEFPRKNVIPLAEGLKAVREFLDSGRLPTCINWEKL